MQTEVFIFLGPEIDCGLGLVVGLEAISMQDFVAKGTVETLVISVLPSRA